MSVAVLDGLIYAMVNSLIYLMQRKWIFRAVLMVMNGRILLKDIHQFRINGFLYHQCMLNDQVCYLTIFLYYIFIFKDASATVLQGVYIADLRNSYY